MAGTRNFLLVNLAVITLSASLGLYFIALSFPSSRIAFRERFLLPQDKKGPTNNTATEYSPFLQMTFSASYGLQDASGNFTSHPFLWPARNWPSSASETQVCLASHSSVDRLFWLAYQAEVWTGPLSVAIFAPGSDLSVAAAVVSYLQRCFPGVIERTSFHLVYPRSKPADLEVVDTFGSDYLSCIAPEEATKQLLQRKVVDLKVDIRYPQNLLRNLARRACPTSYALNVDIDMLVPKNLSENLEEFFQLHGMKCPKCLYLLPVYEVHSSVVSPPESKSELLHLLQAKLARRFHIKVYELHIRGYQFAVLDNAFLVHRGFQTITTYPLYRQAQIQINRVKYQAFKRELHSRLGLRPPPPLPPIRPQSQSKLKRRFRGRAGSSAIIHRNFISALKHGNL